MLLLALAALLGVVLTTFSLFVGSGDVTLAALADPDTAPAALQILMVSRVPRTLALILAGSATAIAGLIMQMLVRNRFVDPSTAGTVESAGLGLLVVTILAPALPIFGKMVIATGFAIAGTALFLLILSRIPLRDILLVPLTGLVLSGIISAASTFIAYRFNLIQTLLGWTVGDFSGVLRGRYELLWLGFPITLAAYFIADRFTVAGMGRDVATNLGVNYRRVVTIGLTIVALISATVVVTVGMIPFLGLVVPNLVSMMIGDNMRRSVPWVAILGALFVLACDILGRTIRAPYEIPISTVVGVFGAALFLYLLLRRPRHRSA